VSASFVPWVITGILGFIALLLAFAFWSARHRGHTEWSAIGEVPRGERFPEMIAALSLASLTHGNDVRLLQNGDGYFPELLKAIEGAKSSVHFETFLWKSGAVSARLVMALSDAARRGVPVRVLLDGIGGMIDREERQALESSGVKLVFFNSARLENLGSFNTRDHRKLAIIDGLVGFVGGHCVVDDWLGHAQDKKHFRDTTARVEGPIVTQLQAAFSDNWTEAAGEVLVGEELFPAQPEKGNIPVHLAYLNLGRRSSSVKVLHHIAIEAAQHDLVIQNPYFLPYDGAKDALCRAKKRGVRVRVMVPDRDATDSKLVSRAGHHGIRPLLECGIEIYMYDRTLLHQKVLVVDDDWSVIGSTNFDDRSFDINEEISMSVFDRGIAKELVDAFEVDVKHAHRVTLESWKSRSVFDKVQDWAAWSFRDQL
jgi:cardiolipin synthase A/B